MARARKRSAHPVLSSSRRHGVLMKCAVILQARYDQVEQTESELRVLEVQFLELIVIDRRRLNVGLAADGHCAPAIGREQSNLAKQCAGSDGLVDFNDLDVARNDIECGGGVLSALHDD